MEFTVTQQDLSAALRVVKAAVRKSSNRPDLFIHADEQGVLLAANDLEIGVSSRVPAEVTKAGSVVAAFTYLAELVRRVPADKLLLSANGDGSVLVCWDKSTYALQTVPGDNFPRLPATDPRNGSGIIVDQQALKLLIQQTAFSALRINDNAFPLAIQGLNFGFGSKPNLITAVSTDGFRVAYQETSCSESGQPSSKELLVPGRAAAELARVLDSGVARVCCQDNGVVLFDLGDVQFFARLIDAEYPRVLDLIPHEYATTIRVGAAALLAACERVALVAADQFRQRQRPVKLSIQPDLLVISASSPERGRAAEKLPVQTINPPSEWTEIVFNSDMLAEGLKRITSTEVFFELLAPEKPARLRPAVEEDGSRFFYVLLPMRMS